MKKKLFLFLSVIIILSCTPKDNGEAAANTAERKQTAGRAAAVGNTSENSAAQQHENIAEISEPEGRDFLLYADLPEQKNMQRDFEIGELQKLSGNDEITSAMIRTAGAFLDSIIAGEVNDALIAGSKREFVMRNLETEMEQTSLRNYRIGIIDTVSPSPSAAVRLETDMGFTEGMLYFIREGGWKINDFQTDFSKAEKKENDKTEWFPYNRAM